MKPGFRFFVAAILCAALLALPAAALTDRPHADSRSGAGTVADRFPFLADLPFALSADTRITAVTGCSFLFARRSPGGEITDAVPSGECVTAFLSLRMGNWIRIRYRGTRAGYVHIGYLDLDLDLDPAETEPQEKAQKPEPITPPPPPSVRYPAVSLAVPDYKQYDPRWDALPLGTEGGTVHEIGCTVTCLAMVVSYRTQSDYTPADAVRDCAFTDGGALIWLPDFSSSVSPDPLADTYRALASGSPVIRHGKTADGQSHWIVIYGFTGGDSLSPDRFLIRDPATVTRTTLAQYLALYPLYVKTVS